MAGTAGSAISPRKASVKCMCAGLTHLHRSFGPERFSNALLQLPQSPACVVIEIDGDEQPQRCLRHDATQTAELAVTARCSASDL